MQVLTIASTKGGVGKSTAAYHLAYYFSNHGSVVLADADPNRSANNWAERSPKPVPFEVRSLETLGNPQCEWLILDSQIVLGELASVAKESNLVIIPTTISALSVEAAMAVADELQELHATYRIMLNIVDPRSKRTALKAIDSLQGLGYELLSTQVRGYSVYEQAALMGVPVSRVPGKGGIAWSDYSSLGKEIRRILNV